MISGKKRHALSPSLYTHPERSPSMEEEYDEDESDWQSMSLTHSSSLSSSSSKRYGTRRLLARTTSSGNASVPSNSTSITTPHYADVYASFLDRYRKRPSSDDNKEDLSTSSHLFPRVLGHLIDAGDSDDEDLNRVSIAESISPLTESELPQPHTSEDRERLEWQIMLASVIEGDVLKSEKTRIAVAMEQSAEEKKRIGQSIWLGIRARFNDVSPEEEMKRLEERRVRIVDPVIDEILEFHAEPLNGGDSHVHVLNQVLALIHKLEAARALYPSLRAFYDDKPAALDKVFQARVDALSTWSTVYQTLRAHIAFIQKWTGSKTLDVLQPNTSGEIPIGSTTGRSANGSAEVGDGSTFVERLLKEDSLQRTFEKGFLITIHAFIGIIRDAQVNMANIFKQMKLPTFENDLVPLVSFPTTLVQASLRVRLDYVQKLKDPEPLIIDQTIDDLKLSIGLACMLKRQYQVFLYPDPGGNWNLPQSIHEDYDTTILEGLAIFFRLIDWKLKSSNKSIYFKETDVLEAYWATFNDVSLTTTGGSALVAERLSGLVNKLIVRITNNFAAQLQTPSNLDSSISSKPGMINQLDSQEIGNPRAMAPEAIIACYSKILDNVRLRYRKLQRFARVLAGRFGNCAEYDLEGVPFDMFVTALVNTDHFLVYTKSFEEEGTYIVASSSLQNRPEIIRRLLTEAFHVTEVLTEDGFRIVDTGIEVDDSEFDESRYLLVLSPRSQFIWDGMVLMLEIPRIDLELKDNRVRLIADGTQRRLAMAKQEFAEISIVYDNDGNALKPYFEPLKCMDEQKAHLPKVNRELRKITRSTNRLAESILESVHAVRGRLRGAPGSQDLLENWYLFASEHGQHAQKLMDWATMAKFDRLLIKLAISWVSFICDDCDPAERRTFRWAVNALEFTLSRTRRDNILRLPEEEFNQMRSKVASCMTLLISHFDILGARSNLEAKREKERLKEMVRLHSTESEADYKLPSPSPDDAVNYGPYAYIDSGVRKFWDKISVSLHHLDASRAALGSEQRVVGRVLDNEKPEDRSLVFLASSSSNISIRWQQGRFIGAGAFGSVYTAVNMDSGSLMAVKEIKFQELTGIHNLYTQIKDELRVMEMLHHPNVVEYYGIEVHRDKVYIFEEYCQGGSLASLLEHGRIEDERIIQVYTMQMLEGLEYLHSRGVVHRDIKPDNILLDHLGVIKFVDFGAAKVLAKNQKTMQMRTRRMMSDRDGDSVTGLQGNSLTGTPMYMSPEVIKNDKRGHSGAMDIWSMGCVVLECATGRKPWSNLDNEWAIMFHIGIAKKGPPLPEPDQLSELGIAFIEKCLTIDSTLRPTARELKEDPWMLDFHEALLNYEAAELAVDPPAQIPPEEDFENAKVARQAAILQEKEVERIQSESPTGSPVAESTPSTP